MTNHKAIELINEHLTKLHLNPNIYEDGTSNLIEALVTAIDILKENGGSSTIESWNEEDDVYVWNIQRGYKWFEICQLSIDQWCLYMCTNYISRGPNRSVLFSSNDPQECVEYAERYTRENLFD